MSGNSRDSGSLQKGFFKRMLGQTPSNAAKQSNIKQRHPGFAVSNDAVVTPGRSAKPQETIVSQAVKKLNKDGYVVYNTPEKEDIYVSIHPETAFFEDDEPEMVRMAGGSFVGSKKNSFSVEIPVKAEPMPEPIIYNQPADLFINASRKEEFDEIDFNEVIIKKNDSFDEEIENAPLFVPSYVETIPQFVERPVPKMESQMAMTSSAKEMQIADPHVSLAGYREVPEYVEEVIDDEPFIEVPVEQTIREEPVVEDIVTFRGATFSEVPFEAEPVKEEVLPEDNILQFTEEAPVFEAILEETVEESIEQPEMIFIEEVAPEEITIVEEVDLEAGTPEGTMFFAGFVEEAYQETEVVAATIEEEILEEPVAVMEEETSFTEDFFEGEMVVPMIDSFEMPEVQVTEAPAGLYVENHEQIDAASMGGDTTDLSSFMEKALEAETAVTSEAAPIQEEFIGKMVDDNDYLCLPAPREVVQEEILIENVSETIVEQPLVYDVEDLVADIMKLTIPGLHTNEEMMVDLAQDLEADIPDDGLESYDEVFAIRQAPKPEVTDTCGVSFNFDGKQSAYNQNPTVNFRF